MKRSAGKLKKDLPKSEVVWVVDLCSNEMAWYITSDKYRNKYSLWKYDGEQYELVSTGKSPELFRKLMDGNST